MMKLRLRVQPKQESETRIALKPIDCGLEGTLVYNLPRRVIEQMQPGAIVEATISLPDQYPIYEHATDERCRQHYEGGWRPIETAPMDTVIVLRARNYFGSCIDVVGVGYGTRPETKRAGVMPYWQAHLIGIPSVSFDTPQAFTPTHWQPLPDSRSL